MRHPRPSLCALLAVLTAAAGVVSAARVCACPPAGRAAVAVQDPGCCPPGKAGKGCCERPAGPIEAGGRQCPCPACDPTPASEPPPAVPPTGDDGGAFDAGLAAAASPVLLPRPADRVVRAALTFALPPPDLVTTLSRRTC